MIHDLIMSLLHLNENKSLKTFLISNASHDFLHPSEHKILESIVKIANNQIEVAKFVKEHSGVIVSNAVHDDALQKGIYLQGLAIGINLCITPYRNAMVELEQRFLNTPTYSLMFLFTELSRFEELLEFLLQFIAGIRAERLHGCALLQYLHRNSLHGNKQIADAVEIIQRSVHSVFIKQLSEWVIYGELDDKYGEFFIQHIDQRTTTATDHQTNSVQTTTTTTLSDATRSVNTDLWRYEIWYEMLPNYLTPTWAGEVLFLGQTVVMFNMDRREIDKHAKTSVRDDETDDPIGSLWDNQDFVQQFQDLHADSGANMLKLVELVEQIKIYVSEKLTKIALKQVDLIKQLKLIKDFFMLGRGELFLEFVKKTQTIQNATLDESTARSVTKAFENAANSVNVTEDLEHFTLSMPLATGTDSIALDIRGIFRHISLKYNVQWPLHLLFSPKVMERYNELFRFLLQIRRAQYDLQTVWCYHREQKMGKLSPMLQFRNQLMFLVDNLQYYLQVDVLESQFSILMDTVQKSKDFEHIQRAHTIFQANVMSLCFLLHDVDITKSMHQSILQTNENPVIIILNQLMDNVSMFCDLSLKCSDPLKKSEKAAFTNYEYMVNENVKDLMKLLMGWKAGAGNAPLNQLLLRLDYNHYYSSQHAKNGHDSEPNKRQSLLFNQSTYFDFLFCPNDDLESKIVLHYSNLEHYFIMRTFYSASDKSMDHGYFNNFGVKHYSKQKIVLRGRRLIEDRLTAAKNLTKAVGSRNE